MGEILKLGRAVITAIIVTAITLWMFATLRDLPARVEQHEASIKELKETKVDKDVYKTDVCYIKETLQEIKNDVKEIKRQKGH